MEPGQHMMETPEAGNRTRVAGMEGEYYQEYSSMKKSYFFRHVSIY